jgi:hypothetical protein
MVAAETADGELSHEEINSGEYTVRAVWTCLNPDLPDRESHVMDESEVDTFEDLADTFGIHNHDNCIDCEADNAHYKGDLDRVEVVDADREVVQNVELEMLVQEYEMADDYGEFKA